MTHLCVAIFVHTAEQATADAARAAELGADLVEFRIDMVSNDQIVRDIVSRCVVPCIVTCRPEWEGGQSGYPDEQRLLLLQAGVEAGAAYWDVEFETLRRATLPDILLERTAKSIVSSHDFTGRPPKLYNLIEEINRSGGLITKVVWTARSIRDNIELFELLQSRSKSTIALCMGEAGLISRVLAKKFGGFLTFASLGTSDGTAPGQISIEQMKRLYRWDTIGFDTKVYGVVASPVAHSMSPAVHNAAFDRIGFDGVYLPMLVEPSYESFKAFMESFLAFEPLHLRGLSVTIPHKENALRYLQWKGAEIEELAQRIGAVNTIVIVPSPGTPRSPRTRGGWKGRGEGLSLYGYNSDHAAILDTITSALNITRDQLADLRVAVIGAGGTGRTAVAALAECGATVVVYNRTKERADALAAEFDGKVGKVVSARMEKLCDSCCHVFINTTSLGMHPNVDASPLGDRLPAFTPETLVFDTVYNPMRTKLLEQAQQAGAKTVGGVEMFVRQAARQFELWTKQGAPIDVMRRALESRLAATANRDEDR
jgi:3-dehydroquinate dehydratase/shikimate dehydrogenase